MKESALSVSSKVRCKASKDFYGIFFEDINRAADGGIYPEMLRNRSFEDGIPPKDVEMLGEDNAVFVNRGGWPDVFNHGEGIPRWTKDLPYTPIPAWYADGAEISLSKDTLNSHREGALRVKLGEGGRIFNVGYAGVPAEEGKEYAFYCFIKSAVPVRLTISIQGERGIYAAAEIAVAAGEEYRRYESLLISSTTDYDAKFVISGPEAEFLIGFTSLMPKETYKGHGLRTDLCKQLKALSPAFMRFPGGCIVEGLSKSTAMRFSDTIGPVWERPSKQLMWHYRSTNGLGFHEYLQLCEDLSVAPLYVINVGLTCQARVGELFEGDELDGMLKEAFNALEYAMGGTDTVFGRMRAENGHPAPFKIKYVEIGNENFGPDYIVRYKKFYEALKAAYPDIIYIANTHTEWFGYKPEVVDEHFYDMPNFFSERANSFDGYPRGVKIFLGEYATVGGERVFNLNCALHESAWLLGAERNQDVVVLTSFAPLFQNVNFTAWAPNLIQFDNHRVCGIPSYHALGILGEYHGEEVLESAVTTGSDCVKQSGLCGIECAYGLKFKNIKVNGAAVGISRRMQNDAELCDGVYTAIPGGEGEVEMTNVDGAVNALWGKKMREFQLNRNKLPEAQSRREVVSLSFGGEVKDGEYEIEVFCTEKTEFAITLWNHLFIEPYGIEEPKLKGWSIRSVRNHRWEIDGDTGSVVQRPFFVPKNKNNFKKLPIKFGEYNTFKVVLQREGFDCFVNGQLVQRGALARYNLVHATADRNGDELNLKIVNLAGEDEEISVTLDFNVEGEACGKLLTGDPPDSNSLDFPLNVKAVPIKIKAAESFTYRAPGNSLTALRLKIKK